MRKLGLIATILTLILTFGLADTFAQTRKTTRKQPVLKKTTATKTVAKPTIKLYTVEQGEIVRVRMKSTISSKTSKVGDTFATTVTEPVYSNTGVIVIPTGSIMTGKLTAVTPAAKKGKSGSIDVDFFQVKTPNGLKYAISGDLTELDSKSAKSDSEGTASGETMKHRKVIFIGGGAGVGAIIGAAAGGGLGAAIGAGAGAGAGLIADFLLKGEEATVKSGTEFGVHLNRAIALPKFVEVETTNQ